MSFSFGTPSSAPANSSLTAGFSFGANKSATLPAKPGFGLSATSQPSTGLFGSSPAPAFGANTSFGASSAFGATPGFGTTSAAPAFGTGTTSTPAFGTGLSTGGLNFGTGSNAAVSTGLTLGAPATTSAGLGGFGASTQSSGLFGTTSTAPAGGGLFGAKLGSTTMAGGLTTTTTPSAGLGGAAPFGTAATTGDSKTEPPKQAKLPNEIAATVDSFKQFVRKHKAISSELMSVSVKPLYNVSREAESTARAVQTASGAVARLRAQSRRVRAAAACALAAAEGLAQGSGEGSAYVSWLVGELEQALHTSRRQLDVAQTQMHAAPNTLTEQELTMGICRMHESLVALAGRLQVAHAQVDAQRQQYLNLRKYILKDPTNVFETPSSTTSLEQILRDAERSGKKSKSTRWSGSSAVLQDPRAALGSNVKLTGPSPFSYVGTTLAPFPATDNAGVTWQAPRASAPLALLPSSVAPQDTGAPFTLQRPPGKRGKQ